FCYQVGLSLSTKLRGGLHAENKLQKPDFNSPVPSSNLSVLIDSVTSLSPPLLFSFPSLYISFTPSSPLLSLSLHLSLPLFLFLHLSLPSSLLLSLSLHLFLPLFSSRLPLPLFSSPLLSLSLSLPLSACVSL